MRCDTHRNLLEETLSHICHERILGRYQRGFTRRGQSRCLLIDRGTKALDNIMAFISHRLNLSVGIDVPVDRYTFETARRQQSFEIAKYLCFINQNSCGVRLTDAPQTKTNQHPMENDGLRIEGAVSVSSFDACATGNREAIVNPRRLGQCEVSVLRDSPIGRGTRFGGWVPFIIPNSVF